MIEKTFSKEEKGIFPYLRRYRDAVRLKYRKGKEINIPKVQHKSPQNRELHFVLVRPEHVFSPPSPKTAYTTVSSIQIQFSFVCNGNMIIFYIS